MKRVLLPFVLPALLIAGCGRQPESGDATPPPPATVRVQTIERRSRAATEEAVGTVRARLQAVLEAKVSGRIEQMLVVPGQQVKSGELLARIEAREVQARLDQVTAIRQQAESDLKRFAALLEQKILPQAEYDAAQSRFRVAEAAVKEVETMLGYTRVLAPFDGVITRKLADVGDLAAPGRPLLELEDSRTLRLEADIPEAIIGKLALGNRLPVRIATMEGNLEGVVSEIAPAADPGSRTSVVKLDLPHSSEIRAGQFGRVTVPVGSTSSLRVPASAVIRRGQMEMVFVNREGRAQLRLVKTGRRVGDELELVSGVDPGEAVVVGNAAGLLDGQPLAIQP